MRDEVPGGRAALSECDPSNKFDDLGGESRFKRDALNCLADMGYFDDVPAPRGPLSRSRLFHPGQRLSKGWFGVLTYKFVRDEVPGGRALLGGCVPAGLFSDLAAQSSFKQDALNCLAGLGYFDQVPLPDGSLPYWKTAQSPPPKWVFVGDISKAEQTILREEMEAVRSYFSARFDVEATGFTVLVSDEHEEFPEVYRDLTGDLTGFYSFIELRYYRLDIPFGRVTPTSAGGALLILHQALDTADNFDSLRHYIVQEYFHVLQGQLAAIMGRPIR